MTDSGDDWRELYPFASHYMELGNARLHYIDEGYRSAPVVVLLHGNLSWSFYFRELITVLRTNYRVIAPDHVGCGLSEKPPNYPYRLAQHVDNLRVLLEKLNISRFGLVMHDWGCAIGMGYAVNHADRVVGCVVTNGAAFYLPVIYWPIRPTRWPLVGDVLVRRLNLFLHIALRRGSTKAMPARVRRGYLAPYGNWKDRVGLLRFVEDVPVESRHPSRLTFEDMEKKLPLLAKVPMLVAWGGGDPVFTVHDFLSGWQRRFPGAQVRLYESAGHYVQEDVGHLLAPEIMGFFDSLL